MCIHDKLDQTFPSGNLLMVNIPYQLESRIELSSLVHYPAESTEEEDVDSTEDKDEEDDIEGQYLTELQDCTTKHCLSHTHDSLSGNGSTEKWEVLLNKWCQM